MEVLKNLPVKLAVTLFDPGVNNDLQTGNPRGAIEKLINNGVIIMLFIIGVLAVIFIIVGGLQYILSGGDEPRMRSAKRTIVAAVGGLIGALVAGGILSFIFGTFGLK